MIDETSSNELIVGATRKPDGTWDMSHAATMPGESKISDPIVDRLRGPLQADSEKESRYQSFQTKVQHEAEQGNLIVWFLRLMNQIKPDDLPNITPDDLVSLQFVTNAPEVQSLRQQFGHDYNRPIFN